MLAYIHSQCLRNADFTLYNTLRLNFLQLFSFLDLRSVAPASERQINTHARLDFDTPIRAHPHLFQSMEASTLGCKCRGRLLIWIMGNLGGAGVSREMDFTDLMAYYPHARLLHDWRSSRRSAEGRCRDWIDGRVMGMDDDMIIEWFFISPSLLFLDCGRTLTSYFMKANQLSQILTTSINFVKKGTINPLRRYLSLHDALPLNAFLLPSLQLPPVVRPIKGHYLAKLG